MSITASEAISRLAGINTIDALRAMINELDVTATGDVTMLFSGEGSKQIVDAMVNQGESLRTVRTTEAADFLDLDTNTALKIKLAELFGDDPEIKGSAADQFLNGNALYDENGQLFKGHP